MPKLFISYRRKSWAFTDRLVDELGKRLDAEIFIDRASVDQDDFEQSILHHLTTSDAVLLIVSEHTFADIIHRDHDWVRREIREALTRGIPLVMVRVEGLLPPAGLPDDIKDVTHKQGIPFYPEYFTPAVERLCDFVVKIGVALRISAARPAPTSSPDEKKIAGRDTFYEALDLMEQGDYSRARFMLESLQASGFKSKVVDVEGLLKRAVEGAEAAEMRQRAALEYEEIAELAKRKVTEADAKAAFAQWCIDYPALIGELDTTELHQRFGIKAQPNVRTSTARGLAHAALIHDIIGDPFEWCRVPAGEFLYGDDNRTLTLPTFAVAKYPITYSQYQVFVEAHDGLRENYWWDGLAHDMRNDPGEQRFKIADHPRENVSWYEAIAFCRWLSWKLGGGFDVEKVDQWAVRLPTEYEWEKAARGTDGRLYPYGSKFDSRRGNTLESGIESTTPVTRYPNGASPYGVMDMSGNVWDWCLTNYAHPKINAKGEDLHTHINRVVRGGVWDRDKDYASAVNREGRPPVGQYPTRGFRLVTTLLNG